MHRSTASQLRLLDNHQLEARCHAEHCDLTSTDAETVLLERFAELVNNPLTSCDVTKLCGVITDARAQFPEEDFLVEPIGFLNDLVDDLRTRRSTVSESAIPQILRTIEVLEDIQQCTANATAQGIEHLDDLESMLEGDQ